MARLLPELIGIPDIKRSHVQHLLEIKHFTENPISKSKTIGPITRSHNHDFSSSWELATSLAAY